MHKPADNDAVVVRDNRLVRASYFMSAAEKRLLYWIFWTYQRTGEREFKISIRELADVCGIKGNNIYQTMYGLCGSFQSRTVVIWDERHDAPRFINFTQGITPDLRDGYIAVTVHPEIVRYIEALKENFTKVALVTAVRLSSFYAMRLYDLAMCHEFRRDGMQYSVAEIKAELGVVEIDPKKGTISSDRFPEWKRFKEKVLDRACLEVNEKTDVKVVFETVKQGRDVTHVRLTIKRNKTGAFVMALPTDEAEVAGKLLKAGLSRAEAQRAMESYMQSDPQRILWHLANMDKAKKPLAWLRAGLKKDYRPQKSFWSDDKAELRREAALRAKAKKAAGNERTEREPEMLAGVLGQTLARLGANVKKRAAGPS